jgi:hypothetical protein
MMKFLHIEMMVRNLTWLLMIVSVPSEQPNKQNLKIEKGRREIERKKVSVNGLTNRVKVQIKQK